VILLSEDHYAETPALTRSKLDPTSANAYELRGEKEHLMSNTVRFQCLDKGLLWNEAGHRSGGHPGRHPARGMLPGRQESLTLFAQRIEAEIPEGQE
jgi:hypothetical protein